MSTHAIQLGIDTFGDITRDVAGNVQSHAQVLRNVVEEGVLADAVGIDFFGVGEHHRADFAISAPETVLAAIASRTTRIRLGSAVTVLSSDDPIRVFQRFSTLNAISNGRAEIILGRGSFTESFPLFGFDLKDYERLFEEKLDLLSVVLASDKTRTNANWEGSTRAPLHEARVYPETEHGALSVWIGVGGSPESVVRAARHGLPLTIAIIGGEPSRFAPFIDLFYRALDHMQQPRLRVAIHSPGFVADTDERARELLWKPYREMRDRIGRERGWPPMGKSEFDQEIESGSLYVGSPETVATKIANTMREMGVSRFDMKYSAGPLQHEHAMRCIELYGTQVIPRVRELLQAHAHPK